MKLGTVFLLCFASSGLPAIGWSAWIAQHAVAEWRDANAAVRTAEAMGYSLRLVEALSLERGALQERAITEGMAADDLPKIAADNDDLLDRTQQSLLAAGLPETAVTQARTMLAIARQRVAASLGFPLAQRDPNLVPAIMAQLYERLDAVEASIALAERGAARADPVVGALVGVASLSVEMRAMAGRRSSNLTAWLAGRVLSSAQLDEEMVLTGQVQHAWDRLQRQVLLVGAPPRLVAAVSAMRDGFFHDAEPRYRAFVALARVGGVPPMPMAPYRRWTITALGGTLLARDAAIAEAVDYGRTLTFQAELHLLMAVGTALSLLVLMGGALLVLLRRLILPVQHLTAAVTRLAGGDVAATVPECGRRDEIGAMAAAIEVFRENAVALRQTNLRFDAALGNMSQGLAMYDAEERLVVVNSRASEIVGLPADSIRVGMTFRDVIALRAANGHFPGQTAEEAYAERRALRVAEGVQVNFEEHVGEGQAGARAIAFSSQTMAGGGWLLTLEDITDRRQTEARIAHMAHHDGLTNLANRILFRSRLEAALVRARRGEPVAVLSLDLDRFKAVNDTFGHPVGDALLQAVARRIRAELRDCDTAARLGGDEFAVVQMAMDQPRQATILAQRLIARVGAPYEIDGHCIVVGLSVGIAAASANDDLDRLLKHADLALYRAKSAGRGTWRCFESEVVTA